MATSPVTLDFSKMQPVNSPATPASTSGVQLDFSKMVPISAAAPSNADTGEQRDDLGNKIIVPKDLGDNSWNPMGNSGEESFEDTMNRAVAYGKTVTPEQIAAQTKQGLRDDVPAVLAAATLAGPAGAAALAGAGEAGAAGGPEALRVLQFTESQLEKFAEAYPHLSKLAGHLGYPAGVVGAYEVFRKLFN